MKEKKARIEDALHATRAAVEEGIVPGGGVAYLSIVSALDNINGANQDQDTGINIIRRSIEEPIRQIVANSGLEPSVIVNKIREAQSVDGVQFGYGYNARTDEFVNMFDDGVIDPKKVSRVALQNASSIAGLLLTTETTIVEKPSKNDGGVGNQDMMY